MTDRRHSEIRNPESPIRPGVLIAFEGIDGSGKSVVARRLAEHFGSRGYDVLQLREPTDGPWGRQIRARAASGQGRASPREELDLFIQDRREDVTQNILPALAAGKLVIIDRYYYSTMAYQGARGLDPEEIRLMNEAFAPVPDLVFILDVPAEIGVIRKRRQQGTVDHFEEVSYLDRVREVFGSIEGEHIQRIDGTACEDRVLDEVRRVAEERIS